MRIERLTVQAIVRVLGRAMYVGAGTARNTVHRRRLGDLLRARQRGRPGSRRSRELGDACELPFYRAPRPNRARVHIGDGVRHVNTGTACATFACTSSIGPGATNSIGAAPATINRLPGPAAPGRLLREPPVRSGRFSRSSTRVDRRCQRERLRSARIAVLRPHRPARAACSASLPEAIACARPTGRDRARRHICLPEDVQAEAFDYPASFFEQRVWQCGARPEPKALVAAGGAIRSLRAARSIVAGGGVHLLRGAGELRAFGAPASRSPRLRPGRRGPLGSPC